ncbi:hypothetical protein VitviT2T_021418 [Vitis vinifera]|uniref:Zinc finger C5HC2-type domain-containing protein n=1 Tax=Vitis vinifera TaxID=29760 RepID=A0ABY9D9R6_VITVI|nr:hypothetical protein VitviT2T_021418 [Vitis vinifera]
MNRDEVVCGKDGILARTLKARVEMKHMMREFLCVSSWALKMDTNFGAINERECTVCLFDLHPSAAGCHCSPDSYACLNHAKQLCSSLEGKLSAVYRWARLDLSLALSSCISKDDL